MTVVCIHYVFIITIFDLIDLGVLNTKQFLVLVYTVKVNSQFKSVP
jgi:hypothetical protein